MLKIFFQRNRFPILMSVIGLVFLITLYVAMRDYSEGTLNLIAIAMLPLCCVGGVYGLMWIYEQEFKEEISMASKATAIKESQE